MWENIDADHVCRNCTADQRLCFRYMDSITPLLFKLQSIFYSYTGWFVGPRWNSKLLVLSCSGSNVVSTQFVGFEKTYFEYFEIRTLHMIIVFLWLKLLYLSVIYILTEPRHENFSNKRKLKRGSATHVRRRSLSASRLHCRVMSN